ncbi:MAG: ATP-grasp domain-containing protein [Deltaproteobacteria bacterium]|nr:ATP-grasp domain-containing protein [Deltaproteobacteria bacterium]
MGYRVLVTGIGGPAGRSAARYFGGRGAFVIGTDVREVGEKADEFLLLPLASSPEFPEALLDLIRETRPVLFVPTVTEELLAVARLKPDIESLGCAVFISSYKAVEIANDKFKTAVVMGEGGVPVPRTIDGSSPREAVIRELGLPLLSKPVFGRGGRGVKVYHTADEVMKEDRSGIIFQEFIPGEEFDINLFMDKGGKETAAVALKKTALKEGIVGNAAGVERASKADAVDVARRASRLLALEGPLDFDIRFRKDGSPALLEINARLGGNSLSAVEVLDALSTAFEKGYRNRDQ